MSNHEADQPTNCPHCNVSLLGGKIPKNQKKHYSGSYWKREIGVEIPEEYDGIWYYYCPDCKGEFGGVRGMFKK